MSARIGFPEFLWIWNHTQSLPTPRLHLSIARWLADRWSSGDRELVLLAFRNSGKSTLVGLFSVWLLTRNPNLRILVLAGDFALAKKMVRNAKRIVERHPVARHLRATHGELWASDQFTVKRPFEFRDPSMLAKGVAANITGLRADVVICDDVEVPNTCDTAAKRQELRTRLQEIDYVLVPNGTKLFVGTPHTFESIYAESPRTGNDDVLQPLQGFSRLELPIVDVNGKSQWEERFPLERIDAIRRRTGPAKFESQMMLRPRSILEGRLDPEDLEIYDNELSYIEGNKEAILTIAGRRLVSASCWWDPAFGSLAGGDGSVIALVFADNAGYFWLHRIKYIKVHVQDGDNTDQATEMCRVVARFVRKYYIPCVTIETNGIGRFLPGLLRVELPRLGIQCAVVERTSTRQKDLRILDAFDAVLAARRLKAHRSVWDSPFITEMRDWRPGTGGRDDGLDAVAGCLLSEPVRLPRWTANTPPAVPRQEWRPGATTAQARHDFPPL